MRNTLLQGLRPPLTEAAPGPDDPELAELAATVRQAAEQTLGRSLAIRHVDAGSCNACELEIHALGNAFYDLERFGFRFVASPRHADVLLVTGPVTHNMREALKRTYRRHACAQVGRGLGRLRCRRRRLCGELRRRWRRLERRSGRPRHPRLSAEPGDASQGPAGADGRRTSSS